MFMKSTDTQFVITFQLALIGIAMIGSLFLIWKAISRVEEKLDTVLFEKKTPEFTFTFPSTPDDVPDGQDHEDSSTTPVTIEEINNFENDDETILTRTKLRQMNLDKIKSICEEKGISTDGTKNQLIDKILQN
jgi:hypothetical protein